jgi:hypothetical protein
MPKPIVLKVLTTGYNQWYAELWEEIMSRQVGTKQYNKWFKAKYPNGLPEPRWECSKCKRVVPISQLSPAEPVNELAPYQTPQICSKCKDV